MSSISSPQVQRPGCVTAYAVLLWIAGGLYILGSLCIGFTSQFASGELTTALCMGLLAAIPMITGIGLWGMKKWGWWLIVVLQSLSLLSVVGNLMYAFTADDSMVITMAIFGAIIGGLISGGILYWFINNRGLFNGQPLQAMTGPDGEIIHQPETTPGSSNTVAIVLGILAVLIFVPIVIIVILVLLGPAIGDVFSEIITNL